MRSSLAAVIAVVASFLLGAASAGRPGEAPILQVEAPAAPIAPVSAGGQARIGDGSLAAARDEVARLRAEVARLESEIVVDREDREERPTPVAIATTPPEAEVRAELARLALRGAQAPLALFEDPALAEAIRAMDGQGIALLSEVLAGGGEGERLVAASILGYLADPRGIAALERALLEDRTGGLLVRRAVAEALAWQTSEAAVPVLARALAETDDPAIRISAAHALALRGREDGVRELRRAAESAEDPFLRQDAFGRLAEAAPPTCRPFFIARFRQSTDPALRHAALQGIANAGGPESLEFLETIALDPTEDPLLVAEARRALGDLSHAAR